MKKQRFSVGCLVRASIHETFQKYADVSQSNRCGCANGILFFSNHNIDTIQAANNREHPCRLHKPFGLPPPKRMGEPLSRHLACLNCHLCSCSAPGTTSARSTPFSRTSRRIRFASRVRSPELLSPSNSSTSSAWIRNLRAMSNSSAFDRPWCHVSGRASGNRVLRIGHSFEEMW